MEGEETMKTKPITFKGWALVSRMSGDPRVGVWGRPVFFNSRKAARAVAYTTEKVRRATLTVEVPDGA